MVNISLKVVLDIRDFANLNNTYIHILSAPNTDATFLNAFFIKQFLDVGRKVAVVSFQDILTHYQGVCQDMICDLKSVSRKESFKFIDGLLLLQECYDNDMDNLLSRIYNEIMSHADTKQILLIVDGLTVLSDIGIHDAQINQFLNKLFLLVKNKSIATLVINQKEDSTIPSPLSYYTSIQSDINVHLKPISTGYNKNITGEMSVTRRPTKDFLDSQKTRFFYLLHQKNIEVYLAGSKLPFRH